MTDNPDNADNPDAPDARDAPGAAPAEPPHTHAARTAADEARSALHAVRTEVARVVVGQDGVLTGLVVALLAGGHVLLEGVPGTAKTLTAKAVAAALQLDFRRVQFTPDLMPADITGQMVYESTTGSFRFREGPVFTHLLLADEINRTPPKAQAALLESMEERRVSVDGVGRPLPNPFMVIATQNPIEYEGTYPLPEAQLDRFLLKLHVGYPTEEQERGVLALHDRGVNVHDVRGSGVRAVASAQHLAAGQAAAAAVACEAPVQAYIVALARATRDSASVSLGVSPRGAAMLLHAAKAWAWLQGKAFVTPDDVKAMAKPTWRHRVGLRPESELDGVTSDGVLDSVLATVPVPR